MESIEHVVEWNNSTTENASEVFCGLIPHDYLEIKLLLISIVGTLVGSFGIFGNVSTVLILTRPSMRNPNNMFLTTLAIFDTCLLLTAFSIYGMEYIIEYLEAINLYIVWLTYLRFAFALSHISQTGSVYTTVAVTVERFLAVCYPRVSKRFCTSRNTAYSIVGVIAFAVLFNSTKFFEVEIVSEPDCSQTLDWQSFHLFPSDLAKNPAYTEIYSLWLTNVVMVFFPFLMLFTLNAIIAYTIRKSLKTIANRKHTEFNELRERSREASIVLVIIVLIFLLCNFWGFFLTLLEHFLGADYLRLQHHVFYMFSREAINFLAIVNSSINFVIYLIFGKDFRKELITIYGCCKLTVSLPDHDKFAVWRQIARRRWISRRARRRATLVNEVRHLSINDFATAFVHSISDDSLQSYLKTRLTQLEKEKSKNNNDTLNVPLEMIKQNGNNNTFCHNNNGFLKHHPTQSTHDLELIIDKPLDEYSDSEIIFV